MARWIERQRHLLDFTLVSLGRLKGKNLALVLTLTLLVFGLESAMLFSQALKKEAGRLLRGRPEILAQRLTAGGQVPIPLSHGDSLRRIRGVVSVQPRLWGYYYDPAVKANYTLLVPEREPPPAGEIFIGAGISRSRQVFPGDILSFRNNRGEPALFRVSGLLPAGSELLTADLILVCAADFRDFFGLAPGLATDFALKVGDIQEQKTIASAISQQLPDTRLILQEEIRRTYDSLFDWRSGITAVLLAGAALAFVILVWEKASGLSAEEKREIGILKAVGWETADVLLLKFWEGTVLALSSFLAGFILAYFHVFLGQAGFFEPALKGWAALYPRFRLTPFVDPGQVSTLFLLTVIPYVAATVIPSWGPATSDPDTGMRG